MGELVTGVNFYLKAGAPADPSPPLGATPEWLNGAGHHWQVSERADTADTASGSDPSWATFTFTSGSTSESRKQH